MRSIVKFFSVTVIIALLPAAVIASPILSVTAALGPGFPNVGNFNAWQANAISALENGTTTAGPPVGATAGSDPSSYFTVKQFPMNYAFVGNLAITAWYGFRDPGTQFNSTFAAEEGNRIFYPVVINGNGTKIALAQLGIKLNSTDSSPFHLMQNPNTLTVASYGPGAVGVIHGIGGAPDTFITSGDPATPVDEIFYRGVGTSITPDAFSPSKNPTLDPSTLVPDAVTTSNDAQANGALNYMSNISPYTASVVYTLTVPGSGTFTGTDSVNVLSRATSPVPLSTLNAPEPGSTALMLLGIAGAATRRRRSR